MCRRWHWSLQERLASKILEWSVSFFVMTHSARKMCTHKCDNFATISVLVIFWSTQFLVCWINKINKTLFHSEQTADERRHSCHGSGYKCFKLKCFLDNNWLCNNFKRYSPRSRVLRSRKRRRRRKEASRFWNFFLNKLQNTLKIYLNGSSNGRILTTGDF